MGWKNAGLPHPAPDPRDHIAQRAMRPGRHDPEHDPAEQRVSARQRVGPRRPARDLPRIGDEARPRRPPAPRIAHQSCRSEEHTSELQSLMRISYAVFCLKKKKKQTKK